MVGKPNAFMVFPVFHTPSEPHATENDSGGGSSSIGDVSKERFCGKNGYKNKFKVTIVARLEIKVTIMNTSEEKRRFAIGILRPQWWQHG